MTGIRIAEEEICSLATTALSRHSLRTEGLKVVLKSLTFATLLHILGSTPLYESDTEYVIGASIPTYEKSILSAVFLLVETGIKVVGLDKHITC